MASDDAGSVLKSPGAAESQEVHCGSFPSAPASRRADSRDSESQTDEGCGTKKIVWWRGGKAAQQFGGAPTGHQETGNQERDRLVSDGTVASCNSKVML